MTHLLIGCVQVCTLYDTDFDNEHVIASLSYDTYSDGTGVHMTPIPKDNQNPLGPVWRNCIETSKFNDEFTDEAHE